MDILNLKSLIWNWLNSYINLHIQKIEFENIKIEYRKKKITENTEKSKYAEKFPKIHHAYNWNSLYLKKNGLEDVLDGE